MIGEIFLRGFSLSSCIWQSTIFIVAGLVGSFILRHRSSRAHQVLFLAMIAAVIVPIMSILVKHYELGVFVAEPVAIQSPAEDLTRGSNYGAPGIISAENFEHNPGLIEKDLPSAMAGSESAEFPWRSVILYVWIAASLILFARLLITFMLGVRLLGRALPLECERIKEALNLARAKLGIDKDVMVHSSRSVRSPVIWCWRRRPVLLVPSAAGQFDNGVDWAGVLCHELAHWKRRDHISGLFAELVVCILPWHPLVWWAKSRLVRLSEQACDDWVVANGQTGTDYAESLLDLIPGGQMAFVPAVVRSKKGLAGRVRRILKDKCGNPRAGAIWALAVSIVAACLVIGVACAQTRPAEPAAATAALFRAIGRNNVKHMRLAIAQGADLEAKNKDGCTPLYAAVATPGGNRAMIKLLLEAGANPNARDPRGWIPLHVAARNWQISTVKLLVSAGSDVNARDKKGMSPAMIAFELGQTDTFGLMVAHGATFSTDLMSAYKGDLSRVQSLIENGKAQETFEQGGLTLLHAAAAGGHTAIVELLLTNGSDVYSQTQAGYTALHHAAAGNHREVAELLLAKGADVNGEPKTPDGWSWTTPSYLHADVHTEPANQTPLHWAIREGHKDMIDWLLARGANPNADGGDYHPLGSPLNWAVWNGDVDIAVLLVSHGAYIHLKSQNYPITPLHDAVLGGDRAMVEALITKTGDTTAAKWALLHATVASGDRQAVEDLLDKGADVNAKGEGGVALHVAALKGHKDIAELLITRGADVDAKSDKRSRTPLHIAAREGHKALAELLLAKGADVNIKDGRNLMPLHLALYSWPTDLAELLVAKDADVNARDTWGQTPLHIAARNGYTDIIRMLLDKGANPNVKEIERGNTPLHIAASGGHKAVAELLISKSVDVNAKTRDGKTPMSLAKEKGHKEIIELLRRHGAKE
ncbi:MAG TPA: ankyrin repeat domain-containing protein [Sedimentisphaerales bacterium]|nr:ankyrin repeat domain-containing protein [Sedimentisphaerales bacterium]